ncbi:unnamed protein product [Allacma fusca]|uniref:Uncharacterized protein n=1 Tax=Allacma fusca TaxID=39272 RepID=A0A8J2MBE9_9HEXA|nr:unnamed protein product [Allacma fusca]
MTSKVRVGSSGSGSGDLITADELFEILIMILPEAEVIKNAFIKWISLPDDMKLSMESKLESLTVSGPVIPSSPKEINLYKGYSMSRILLRVFNEWSYIQDTLGAPGIQSGFTALPKRLEAEITMMMKCMQEVLEYVIRERAECRRKFLSQLQPGSEMGKIENTGGNPTYICKPVARSLSDTAMALSAGDHIYARMEITSALSAGKIPTRADLVEASPTGVDNGEESDDTEVEPTYDTEEDGFEHFGDEADLAKYLLNISDDPLLDDGGQYTSDSGNSEDDDDSSD